MLLVPHSIELDDAIGHLALRALELDDLVCHPALHAIELDIVLDGDLHLGVCPLALACSHCRSVTIGVDKHVPDYKS